MSLANDLQKLCLAKIDVPPSRRTLLCHPWRYGEYVGASDGKALLAVKTSRIVNFEDDAVVAMIKNAWPSTLTSRRSASLDELRAFCRRDDDDFGPHALRRIAGACVNGDLVRKFLPVAVVGRGRCRMHAVVGHSLVVCAADHSWLALIMCVTCDRDSIPDFGKRKNARAR